MLIKLLITLCGLNANVFDTLNKNMTYSVSALNIIVLLSSCVSPKIVEEIKQQRQKHF